jgi:hypothetical protein
VLILPENKKIGLSRRLEKTAEIAGGNMIEQLLDAILALVANFFSLDNEHDDTDFSTSATVNIQEIASKLTLWRMVTAKHPNSLRMGLSAIKMRVMDFAQQYIEGLPTRIHKAYLSNPEKLVVDTPFSLLRITEHLAAMGELFQLDLITLIRPILLDQLRAFGQGKQTNTIIGKCEERPVGRGISLRGLAICYYTSISHFANVDISAQLLTWRAAVVEFLQAHRAEVERWGYWEERYEAEMADLDKRITNYRPLPDSEPLTDVTI